MATPQPHRSRKEIEVSIKLAMHLIGAGHTPRQCVKELRTRLKLSRTTAERMVTRAGQRFLDIAKKTPEEILHICTSHLLDIASSKEGEAGPRVSAVRELAKLFGLVEKRLDVTVKHEGRELTREEKADAILRELALAKSAKARDN